VECTGRNFLNHFQVAFGKVQGSRVTKKGSS
jgi:hypothetical protein